MNYTPNYFNRRRTVRNFQPGRPVDPALIARLVEAAAHAPTTGNMQLYSVVATADPEKLKAVRACHFNQPASQAPLLLTIVADLRRYARWCALGNAPDPGVDTLQMLMSALLDATAFAQQLTTLLELEGLGVCWLGTALYNAEALARELNLPPHTLPIITLSVGWPADNALDEPAADRLPLAAILHSETYTEPSDEALSALYEAKEQLPENRAFVADNGLSSLAQVYASVRYPKASSEASSATLLDFLRSQSFSL